MSTAKKFKYGLTLLISGGGLYLALFAVSAYFKIDKICKEPSKIQFTEYLKFEIPSEQLVFPFLLAAVGIFIMISEPLGKLLSLLGKIRVNIGGPK